MIETLIKKDLQEMEMKIVEKITTVLLEQMILLLQNY